MKIFCKDFKDQAMKVINCEKNEIIPLTNKEKESYENQEIFHICKKEFNNDNKVRDHCHYTGKYRGAAHNKCNLRYKIPKEIPVVFHNGPTYDYHFIIKQLAREFKGNFECLGENMEKYITFSAPIKKEHDNGKTTTYKLKFIDSCRFMQSSLSNLVDNLSEINNKEPNKFMDTMRSMTDSLSQSIDKVSKIDQKISQNKFIDNMRSMLFSLTKSIDKVSEIDRMEALNIKNLGEYHDLYVQSDTALLADVFESFRDKCLEIYEFDPAHFLSAPGLARQACLKKT